jgi:hypothetical protein
MRKLLHVPMAFLLLTSLFASCKKEIISEPAANPSTLSVSIAPPEISKTNSSYEVASTEYNSCTLENMYVTGIVTYSSGYRQSTNTLYITYSANYDGLSAVGLSSGRSYQASGHVSETVKAIVDYDAISIVNRTITNRVTYLTAGAQNNLSATVISHLTFDRTGSTLINFVDNQWETCR